MASFSSRGEGVLAGQEVFLKNGLMEYGSILGHGAHLVPDFTTDYLHRAAVSANEPKVFSSETPQERTIADFKANRYDVASGASLI
jgi:nitric oxide reductase subunit B